jgi:hypothetical protein
MPISTYAPFFKQMGLHTFAAALFLLSLSAAEAEAPAAIATAEETLVATLHAEGVQIYECKANAQGQDSWQFREPVATLIMNGKTIGRHYAGPSWELADGSIVTAKVIGSASGATVSDIPLLKLEVTSRHGAGQLTPVTTIQRLNTRGGALEGLCSTPGAMASMPYAADYAFWQ